MGQVIKREKITIVIDTYNDRQTGQEKKKRRTIGELVTMQNDDMSTYQFGQLWGPTGCTDFSVYEEDGPAQAMQVAQPQQGLQPQQATQQPYNPQSVGAQNAGGVPPTPQGQNFNTSFDDSIPF